MKINEIIKWNLKNNCGKMKLEIKQQKKKKTCQSSWAGPLFSQLVKYIVNIVVWGFFRVVMEPLDRDGPYIRCCFCFHPVSEKIGVWLVPFWMTIDLTGAKRRSGMSIQSMSFDRFNRSIVKARGLTGFDAFHISVEFERPPSWRGNLRRISRWRSAGLRGCACVFMERGNRLWTRIH